MIARTEKIDAPVGVFRRMPMAQYLAIDAVGSSFLRDMEKKCPRWARWRASSEKTTGTMERGTRVSCRLLEPDVWDDLYVVSGQCEARYGSGKNAGQQCVNGGKILTERGWRCGTHAKGEEDLSLGRETVTEGEVAEVDAIVEALRANHEIAAVLDEASETELTVVWIDEATGLKCKARIDVVCEIRQACFDLKTAADASPERWPWVMKDGLLHVQAAHHLAGAKVVGFDVHEFGHLVVENSAPFLTCFRPRLTADAMLVGERIRREQLQRYAECVQRGRWPGYERGESDLPPSYMSPFLAGEEMTA